MSRNEQIERIRKISIPDFLASVDVPRPKIIGNELYYHSPFRSDSTPSFSVNPSRNVWFDHGEDIGGDIIDLAMQLLSLDLPTALQMLEQISLNPQVKHLAAVSDPVPAKKKVNTTMRITRIEELEKSQVLMGYLISRGIKMNLLLSNRQTLSYLKVVFYEVEGKEKEYYAVGWRNSAGDYELNSRNFKSFIGEKKTFTYIKGTVPGMAIFESFIDYLSALTHYGVTSLGYDILVLNSTRIAKTTLDLVLAQPHLHYFLDNDEAGIKCRTWYMNNTVGIPCTNHSLLYEDYKDFNDKLTNTLPQKPLPHPNDKYSELSKRARWWLWVCFHEIDENTGEDKQCVFYCWNNHQTGYEHLLYLRAFTLYNAKVSKLCERIKGREYKVIDEQWH